MIKKKKNSVIYFYIFFEIINKIFKAASCRPKFLLILEGKILDEVNGANIPELTEKIYKNMPFYSN